MTTTKLNDINKELEMAHGVLSYIGITENHAYKNGHWVLTIQSEDDKENKFSKVFGSKEDMATECTAFAQAMMEICHKWFKECVRDNMLDAWKDGAKREPVTDVKINPPTKKTEH